MQASTGTVDYRDDHFVVSCPFDGSVHAELRALPKHQFDQGIWRIPRHIKSVAGLMMVARSKQWQLTRLAAQALAEIREEAEQAEFYVQLVQGSAGEPWFKCRADDSELEGMLDALTGAERDDEPSVWVIPASDSGACEQLRQIVDLDARFEIDPAARRLLDDPEIWEAPARLEVTPAVEPSDELHATPRPAHENTKSGIAAAFEREQELLAWSRAVIAEAEQSALDGRLRPYQRAGARYLQTAERAFLADDKGLGKSVQALAAIEASSAYPALILCAAASELSWQREVAHWLSGARSCTVVDGSDAGIPDSDIVVVQYDLLHRRREELKAKKFSAIVADDSDQLRNERSLKTRAALELADTVTDLRFCLSSKVLLDQPIHMLPQLMFLGRLDDFQGRNAFVERYCRPRHDVSGTRYGAAHVAELELRLRSCCLCRRELQQVAAQLPFPQRYQQAVRTDESLRARERSLLSQLVAARESELAGPSDEAAADARAAVAVRVAELLGLAGELKVDGVAEWIDHFLQSGEWLAVTVQHEAVSRAFERKYPEAVFVRANGTCSLGGQVVNPFFVADAKLAFFEVGTSGAALRLARGRHVARAELGVATRELSELLLDGRSKESSGAEWTLVGDLDVDRALLQVDAQQPPHGAELDVLCDALLQRDPHHALVVAPRSRLQQS